MKEEKKCEDCTLKACPEACFNSHPGSEIALKKLLYNMHMDAFITQAEEDI